MVVACLSYLVAAALPSWHQYRSGQRLIQTAETLAQDLRQARSLALTHNTPYFIHYDLVTSHDAGPAAEEWCALLADRPDCHCRVANTEPACALPAANEQLRTSAAAFPGIHLREAAFGGRNYTRFEPVRGTARFGRLRLGDDFEHQLQITISLLGRVRICRPAGTTAMATYPPC